jgi:hypothetical protein
MRLGWLSFIFIFNLSLAAWGQVNTERYRKDYDKKGFLVNNALGFSFSKGNTEELEVSNNFRLDYTSNKFHYFTILDYNFKRTETIKSKDNGFVHLRTLRHFDNRAYLAEVFAQWQFDEFIMLQNRFLLGTGLRFDLSRLLTEGNDDEKDWKIFAGVGLMYEYEDYMTEPLTVFRLWRSTNYLSVIWDIGENLGIKLVNYYQPAISKFSNYRFSTDLGVDFKLFKQLSFEVAVSYTYRSVAVGNTKRGDISIKNSLLLSLP